MHPAAGNFNRKKDQKGSAAVPAASVGILPTTSKVEQRRPACGLFNQSWDYDITIFPIPNGPCKTKGRIPPMIRRNWPSTDSARIHKTLPHHPYQKILSFHPRESASIRGSFSLTNSRSFARFAVHEEVDEAEIQRPEINQLP
jgi:hypothetical protein